MKIIPSRIYARHRGHDDALARHRTKRRHSVGLHSGRHAAFSIADHRADRDHGTKDVGLAAATAPRPAQRGPDARKHGPRDARSRERRRLDHRRRRSVRRDVVALRGPRRYRARDRRDSRRLGLRRVFSRDRRIRLRTAPQDSKGIDARISVLRAPRSRMSRVDRRPLQGHGVFLFVTFGSCGTLIASNRVSLISSTHFC